MNNITHGNTIGVELDQLTQTVVAEIPPDTPQRIDVETPHSVMPFLVIKREASTNLIIMNNGAVDQQRALGTPTFQRSSWWRNIPHHQIYFCDPATVGQQMMSLAWGQLECGHWVVPDATRALTLMSRALGIESSSRRCYFGSSAGGFMALAMNIHDPGARSLVNNPQFDWTRWMADSVNAVRKARFPGLLPADIREHFPTRTNVLRLAVARDVPLRTEVHVNLASKHDRLVDYPMFQQFQIDYPHLIDAVRVHPYFNIEDGHNPMNQQRTLARISKAFMNDAT